MSFTIRSGLRRRRLRALDRVALDVGRGEVVAVVGESGSGKSTIARVLAQLHRQTEGQVLLDGEPVDARGTRRFRRYCGHVQLIFQDPFASLNPQRTVKHHLVDALRIHGHTRADAPDAAARLLERVRLSPARRFLDAYPHELSGGQRQRVSIARALAAGPRVLLADEPVSMLDVSIRLEILDLLAELREELGLGVLYITHDIASARHVADRVLVMYAGRIVERGDAEQVTQHPRHPYTRLLLASAPDPDAATTDGVAAASLSRSAEPPSLIDPAPGCRFAPRCPVATVACDGEEPPDIDVGDGAVVRCWAYSREPSALPLPRLTVTS